MTSKGDKMAQKLNCNESQALIDIFIILDENLILCFIVQQVYECINKRHQVNRKRKKQIQKLLKASNKKPHRSGKPNNPYLAADKYCGSSTRVSEEQNNV